MVGREEPEVPGCPQSLLEWCQCRELRNWLWGKSGGGSLAPRQGRPWEKWTVRCQRETKKSGSEEEAAAVVACDGTLCCLMTRPVLLASTWSSYSACLAARWALHPLHPAYRMEQQVQLEGQEDKMKFVKWSVNLTKGLLLNLCLICKYKEDNSNLFKPGSYFCSFGPYF